MENRRDFFRVDLPVNMCGEISILKVCENIVNSKKRNICIIDISAGGLKFKSDLDFPVENVIYNFSFSLYEEEYEINGTIKWKSQNKNKTFNYGIMFSNNEKEKEALVHIMARLMRQVKRSVNTIYNICTVKCPNLKFVK